MKKLKSVFVFVVCFAIYALINNTLKANNTPKNIRIIDLGPLLIYFIYDFVVIFKKLKK